MRVLWREGSEGAKLMESFCEEPSMKRAEARAWVGGCVQCRAGRSWPGWRGGVAGGSREAGTARSQLPELVELTLSLPGQWRQESGESREKG